MSILFDPIKVGDLKLPNRIIMAPLTRCRSDNNRVPTPSMARYYGMRAEAGLIISEATSVCAMGVGYPNTPGIWTKEQIKGWQLVTKAVHENGGRIFLQLWHVGRISHPTYLGGQLPVAPSSIKPDGHVNLMRPTTPYVVPRELTIDEIKQVVEDFKQGAINAKEAGFDGVEIHGANGYLIDQFLQDGSNKRTDIYGGSIENRVRLLLEITDAVISVWGSGRVGVHLAPKCDFFDMGDSDRLALFSYVARELGKRRIAFICARENQGDGYIGDKLRHEFGGVYIVNQGLSQNDAEAVILDKNADAAAFGTLFIANSDLVKRFKLSAPLNEANPKTFYGYELGDIGYNDYALLEM